jgi:hypothetical protein
LFQTPPRSRLTQTAYNYPVYPPLM